MTDGPTTPTPAPGGSASLVDRAKNMILTPKTEWDRVDAEPATIGGIYTSYVMILAAIPAVCSTIGMLFFMPRVAPVVEAYGQALGLPVITTTSIIAGGIIDYVLALASVYIMALIINALAPNFGGTKDQLKAFKVAAYYPTAVWVASVVTIIPFLALLVFIAVIYALYTLFLGLPKLMRVPEDKNVGYFVVTLVVAVVVFMVVGYIKNRIVYGGIF